MNNTVEQLKRFIVAGLSAVAVDLLTYYLLAKICNPSLSKGISFLLGTIVAYMINKLWTFSENKHQFKQITKFVVLYTSTLIINVLINKIVLVIFPSLSLLAFFAATASSTVLNFIGQKWWVFRNDKKIINSGTLLQ